VSLSHSLTALWSGREDRTRRVSLKAGGGPAALRSPLPGFTGPSATAV
jgi:hypothetical protein